MRANAQPNQPAEWRSPKDLRLHRDADRVPSMTASEDAALHADIAERDIQVPLDITKEGVVLDGRHRLRIALALGLDRVPVRVVDPPDEVEYMLLAALQRRQLSESQRAALALELDEYRATRTNAAQRKRANLKNSRVDVASMPHRRGRSRDHAARLAGVCPRLVQHAITVRSTDPGLYDQVKAGEVALGRAVKDIRLKARYAEIGESPPLPIGRFDLIYADPPWQLGSPGSSGSPEQHYPTMPTPDIAGLAIPSADDAVLLMWAVTSLMPDALEVIDAWGFTYKSGFVWVKPSIGPGNYVRNRHELLLIATRGNYPPPLPKHRPDSVVEAPRGRHSEKPKCFYERLEQMWPNATKLELFARGKARPGWTVWGNEATP